MSASPQNDLEASPDRPQTPPDRIVLTGFMAAGKTTSGRLLAQTLGWPFIDADSEIEAKTGLTIAEIFRIHGEPHFRAMEHEVIRNLLNHSSLVLAMGGGAIEDARTREILLATPGTHLIYLEASFETVLTRCGDTDSVRPVLADRENLRSRYLKRLPLYRQSHQTIAVDNLHPSEVVQSIIAACRLSPSPTNPTL